MDKDEILAELLAEVAAGRVDRVQAVATAHLPADLHAQLRATSEAFAALAVTAPPVQPPATLRTRLLASLAHPVRATRKAILVVDMLNDHLTPGGPAEVPRARAIVPAMSKRLAAARAEGIPIVYVCDSHAPDDPDLIDWRAHNIAGSPGAQIWHELAPAANDVIVEKPTYSGFVRSSLDRTLDALKVDTLVITGCLTEIGLLATATDALQRGYAVEMPADSQAGMTDASEETVIQLLRVMTPYGAARQELLTRLAS